MRGRTAEETNEFSGAGLIRELVSLMRMTRGTHLSTQFTPFASTLQPLHLSLSFIRLSLSLASSLTCHFRPNQSLSFSLFCCFMQPSLFLSHFTLTRSVHLSLLPLYFLSSIFNASLSLLSIFLTVSCISLPLFHAFLSIAISFMHHTSVSFSLSCLPCFFFLDDRLIVTSL